MGPVPPSSMHSMSSSLIPARSKHLGEQRIVAVDEPRAWSGPGTRASAQALKNCLLVSACRSNGTPGRPCRKSPCPDLPGQSGAISSSHPRRTRGGPWQCPVPEPASRRRTPGRRAGRAETLTRHMSLFAQRTRRNGLSRHGPWRSSETARRFQEFSLDTFHDDGDRFGRGVDLEHGGAVPMFPDGVFAASLRRVHRDRDTDG